MKMIWQTLWVSILIVSESYYEAYGGSESTAEADTVEVIREDFTVSSQPGITLSVRRVTTEHSNRQSTLLMLHGGGPGAVASFDLRVEGGSLAADLARAGMTVYLMNIRGWGGSTNPAVADDDTTVVNVTYREAALDIEAVVNQILTREGIDQLALFGWATGGHWGGYYTTLHNEQISHFVSLNSLYGVNAPWVLRPHFADSLQPNQYDRSAGPWRTAEAASLTAAWDRTIPTEDKTQWRDPAVATAYQRTAVAQDIGGSKRNPPSMRVPSGYREESFYMSLGTEYWNARDIRVPVLILRGELDFWSRPQDAVALEEALTHSPRVKMVTIPQGTHYLFLDRPKRGRRQLIEEMIDFLGVDQRTY